MYRRLGKAIGEARREAGLTQKALGDVLGLSRHSVSNIEAGRQGFSAFTLLAIDRAVGGLDIPDMPTDPRGDARRPG